MKVFYIVNMDPRKLGGLFLATFERLRRISSYVDSVYVVHNNYYESYLSGLVRKFLNRPNYASKLEEVSDYCGIRIHNLNYKKGVMYYLSKRLKRNNLIASHYERKYSEFLKRTDIIHAHWGWPNGYIAYQLGITYEKPYYISFHGSDITSVQKNNIKSLLKAMENANKCFFVSRGLLDIAKGCGYTGENGIVSYNGVDTDIFHPFSGHKHQTVGFAGALKIVKGADLLPSIFSKIFEHKKDVRFVLIGDGELKENLTKEFAHRKIPVDVRGFIPPEDMPNAMRDINVLVVPSRNEGLGMVILEANAMDIVVVGTRVGGIPEAIGFNDNIIDIDENIVSKIATRVIEILENPRQEREKYRERVVECFSWEKIVQEELAVYRDR